MRLVRQLVTASLLAAVAGCSDSTGPEEIAGTWTATEFTVESGETVTDVLDEGGSLTITLAAAGTTTGTLIVPASVTGEGPLNASMSGTFTLDDDVITFDQAADTFVRDIEWTVSGDAMTGTGTFGEATVMVRLER